MLWHTFMDSKRNYGGRMKKMMEESIIRNYGGGMIDGEFNEINAKSIEVIKRRITDLQKPYFIDDLSFGTDCQPSLMTA